MSFLPAISEKAAKAIRETIRDWRLAATRNNQSLEEIAGLVNPSVRGWVNVLRPPPFSYVREQDNRREIGDS